MSLLHGKGQVCELDQVSRGPRSRRTGRTPVRKCTVDPSPDNLTLSNKMVRQAAALPILMVGEALVTRLLL